MATGYLLHSRPYRENSSLQTFFTDTDGRVDVVSRRVRRRGMQPAAAPALFAACELAWHGSRELKTLQYCEPAAPAIALSGRCLFCGLYINELLYRLLPKQVSEQPLFVAYAGTLANLSAGQDMEACLRQFELFLLACLGYGLALDQDVTGQVLDPHASYRFWPEHGLVLLPSEGAGANALVAEGKHFLAIQANQFVDETTRRIAKQMMRMALTPLLGSRPLSSRELFR